MWRFVINLVSVFPRDPVVHFPQSQPIRLHGKIPQVKSGVKYSAMIALEILISFPWIHSDHNYRVLVSVLGILTSLRILLYPHQLYDTLCNPSG
jgi:hypothetical protein